MGTYRVAELKDTVAQMCSDDYKERFKAEYVQVAIRYQKLKRMLDRWDEGKLNFQPTCPRGVYNFQIRAMADYIASLEARAAIENIELL
ncbi:MAG: crAss001_48 related protein [Ruminococcus callidus]